MQELNVETEFFEMSLVFHDWVIEKLNDDTDLISRYFFPVD